MINLLDGATIIALLGLFFSIIWNSVNLKKANQTQKDILTHDMVKEEISNWKYIHEQKEKYKGNIPKSVKNHIFNYYEYLAYLILKGKIDRREAKKMWKPNILGMYEDFKEEFLETRTELRKLYNKWKD